MNRRQYKKRAKQKGQKYEDVKGLSIKDIMGVSDNDISSLKERDLYKLTKRLADAANKRIKRLRVSGENTPALRSIEASGGLLSLAGKNRNELRAEFARAKNFLQFQTSTLRAARSVRRQFEKYVGATLSDEQIGHFWKVFHKLQEDKAIDINNRYQIAQQTVAEIVKDNDLTDYEDISADEKESLWEDLFDKARDQLNLSYEEMKEVEVSENDELLRKYSIGGNL